MVERVRKTRQKIVITKSNMPAAKRAPIDEIETKVIGKLRGSVRINRDIIHPIDEGWEAAT
ncbi:MAG: type II toxin-antitoxin system prevent-host-death family antitoxin [Verrucomicrobia bacterium]|nr:type II toxin-antitoxin system prevent-host-death family antitoxin [Verrucomicrobiota bacterium]